MLKLYLIKNTYVVLYKIIKFSLLHIKYLNKYR